jgi:polyisoprenoid-binding protein YceI
VILDTKFKGQAVNPWGQIVAAFKGSTTINRKEWGLSWNAALEAGGFLVGEQIELTLNVELNEAK